MFDVRQFAKLLSGGYRFGINNHAEIVKGLRDLADGFERGDYILQEVDGVAYIRHDDFTMTKVSFTFAEKEAKPEDYSG